MSPRSSRSRLPLVPIALGAIALGVGGGALVAGAIGGQPPAAEPVAVVDTNPPTSLLPDTTAMGAVELRSPDPASLVPYYVEGVGLEVLADGGDVVSLGADGQELLRIVRSDAPADDPREAGLYHSAFLFPHETALAEALVRMSEVAPETYQGSADHAVSLAFYFGDPQGNGVELYVDRPRDRWEWADGRVTMGSAPLDPSTFIARYLDAEAAEAATTMGHVHLRVGDLEAARAFYEGVLGFAVTAEAQGAVFYAAGGYHHHLATNTWSSAGAGPRSDRAGLGEVTIRLGDEAALADLVARAQEAGVAVVADATSARLADPWGTRLVILA